MGFKSGRTTDQGMRVCVIEGRKLYVHPARYILMRQKIADADVAGRNPDEAAEEALRIAGLLNLEIAAARYQGFEIVVDYELYR